MRGRRVLLVRRPEPDVCATEHQGGSIVFVRFGDGCGDRFPIVSVDGGRVPAVRIEPGGHILGERKVGRAVDRYVVVVVQVGDLAKSEVSGE